MRAALTFLMLTTLSGCALLDMLPERTPAAVPIAKVYRSKSVDGHEIRRVAVIPFTDRAGHPSWTQAIEQALVAAMRKNHPLDIVRLPASALTDREEKNFHEDATVHQETLVRLRKAYNIDAVIFATVTHFRAYTPMLVGLKLDMFSAGAGDVVWEVNAVYDAGAADVAQDVHNYHDTVLASDDSLEGHKLILLSPSRFTRYACARIVETW